MSKKDIATFVGFVGMVLFLCHMMIITDDVLKVVNDPNEDNKPSEILKLVVDVNRYLG